MREPKLSKEPEGHTSQLSRPLAISLDQAEEIAGKVRD